MPMDFPDMKSLISTAKICGFREPEENELEVSYRAAFADFMESKDFVMACEIRNKKGWDKFTDKENTMMLVRAFLKK